MGDFLISVDIGTRALISNSLPFHKSTAGLKALRQQINLVKTPIEIILVIDKKLENIVEKKNPYETIVPINNKGRGYNFVEGVRRATGDIVVFLHSDTQLPLGWDIAIRKALHDNNVIGGGFSLGYDQKSKYIDFGVLVTDLLYLISGELWGDRALFVRSKLLKDNLSVMEVPIMEDVRLSKLMNKKGRVIVLKEKVMTSASDFAKYGWFRKTLRTFKARAWYALGGDPHKIFDYYYSR